MLAWLENTQFSALVRSELWGWPLALTLHAFGTAIVIGFILIINLRLLGLFKAIPYAALKRLFPLIWVGVLLQLLSGFALWMTKPTQYVADAAFMLKSSLVIVGIILTLYFYGTVKREAAAWETAGAVSPRAMKLVAATLLVWCGVLVMGRLTAHLGSLYIG
ncbi:MAG TPA: hypothetical protein VIY51_26265 [Xanthobacteraceae bacterium]